MAQSEIEAYFYEETDGLEISKITLVETKAAYLWTINCYLIETSQGISFYVFEGDTLPTKVPDQGIISEIQMQMDILTAKLLQKTK